MSTDSHWLLEFLLHLIPHMNFSCTLLFSKVSMTPQTNQVAAWGDIVLVLAVFTNILLKINFCVSFVYILTTNWQTPKHVKPAYKCNCCKIYDAFITVFGNFGFYCNTAVVVLIG